MEQLRDTLPDGLLADIKEYLGITWQDEATDRKIGGLIADGITYINGKHGGEPDYAQDGLPRTLLKDYVRYARDYALDVFESNYRHMILAMQHREKAARYETESL